MPATWLAREPWCVRTRDHLDVTAVTHERRQEPTHHADDESAEHRCPESRHDEAADELSGEPETEAVEDEEEETEREQRHWQGEHDENRTDDRIDESQDESRSERGQHSSDGEAGYDGRREVNRDGVDQNPEEETHALMIAQGNEEGGSGAGTGVPTPERSSLSRYAQTWLRVPVCTGILVLRCFYNRALPDHSLDSAPDRPGGVSIMTSAPVATTTESLAPSSSVASINTPAIGRSQ